MNNILKKKRRNEKKNRNSRDEIPLSLYIIYLFFLLIVNIPLSVNISKVIKAINQSIKCNINPKIKKKFIAGRASSHENNLFNVRVWVCGPGF